MLLISFLDHARSARSSALLNGYLLLTLSFRCCADENPVEYQSIPAVCAYFHRLAGRKGGHLYLGASWKVAMDRPVHPGSPWTRGDEQHLQLGFLLLAETVAVAWLQQNSRSGRPLPGKSRRYGRASVAETAESSQLPEGGLKGNALLIGLF